MAFEETRCSNQHCVRNREHRGGRYRLIGGKWYCHECGPEAVVANPGKNLWDFETTHFNGERTHVRSLNHLRQLEKKFGVSNHAANNYERSW